jgi:uncharacterized membrane protein
MGRTRLEAFSDGVIAVIITIMVLELKEPASEGFDAFRNLWPVLLIYLFSFINVGIYWNNHHHLMHLVPRVNGMILWANLHLLFWLSLVPFGTAWLGTHPAASAPTTVYAVILLAASLAYWLLQCAVIRFQGTGSLMASAIGRDFKGKLSSTIYLIAITVSFVSPHGAQGLLVLVALLWLIPDRRVERVISDLPPGESE